MSSSTRPAWINIAFVALFSLMVAAWVIMLAGVGEFWRVGLRSPRKRALSRHRESPVLWRLVNCNSQRRRRPKLVHQAA